MPTKKTSPGTNANGSFSPLFKMTVFMTILAVLLAVYAWNGHQSASDLIIANPSDPVIKAYHQAIVDAPNNGLYNEQQGQWIAARGNPSDSDSGSDSSGSSGSSSSSNLSPISRRSMETYLSKGYELISVMNANPDCQSAPQSNWTRYSALSRYGWDRTVEESGSGNGQGRDPRGIGKGVENMYNSLQISLDVDQNPWITWRHWRQTSHGSVDNPRVYKPTEGEYGVIYNPQLIVCYDVKSPDYVGAMDDPPITGAAVVPLKQLSDVAFLEWANTYITNDPQVHELKGFLHQYVTNDDTLWVAKNVMEASNQKLKWWMAQDSDKGPFFLDASTDGAKQILSTPNGNGIAWFFAQHKWQLGPYKFLGVSIFFNEEDKNIPADGSAPPDEDDWRYNILFHVAPTSAWWWTDRIGINPVTTSPSTIDPVTTDPVLNNPVTTAAASTTT